MFFAGYSGVLHYLQLAGHELATIGINVTNNKIPNHLTCLMIDYDMNDLGYITN